MTDQDYRTAVEWAAAHGAEIEYCDARGRWYTVKNPAWYWGLGRSYRVKPSTPSTPAPDISAIERRLAALEAKILDVKPTPQQPLEFWANVYTNRNGDECIGALRKTREKAIMDAGLNPLRTALFREVVGGDQP